MVVDKLGALKRDDYDQLIQICDAMAGSEGVMDMEELMNDVRRRYCHYSQKMWDGNIAAKDYFEKKLGENIYQVVGIDDFHIYS